MSSCSAEVGCHNHQNAFPVDTNLSKNNECPLEHDHDEKQEESGDVDFKPFPKETPLLEAYSSLSSDIEGLDGGVIDSGGLTSAASATTFLSKAPNQVQNYAVVDSEHGEEVLMQTTVFSGGACKTGSEITLSTGLEDRKSVLLSEEKETFHEKDTCSSSGTVVVNDVKFEEFTNTSHSRKLTVDKNDEDAICRRTRARCSLAGSTLDELETFLQVTNNDDELQNVDDEEEYRKFLAAVLQGGDGDHPAIQENENIDDDDDVNDADFELEIEEALESGVDENLRGETEEQEYDAGGRRYETRSNRCQKASVQREKNLLGQLNRPLRPLFPNTPIAPFPAIDVKKLLLENASHFSLPVFSICVLDPSREHIASQVQGLISEMLHKRDQALALGGVPYRSFCFFPPYIHPTVPDELPKILPAQSTFGSFSTFNVRRDSSFGNNMVPPSNSIFPAKGRYEYGSSGLVGHFQTAYGSFWVPFVKGPVLSVMDVAPLNLVGSYMDDMSTAVQEYQRQHVGVTSDTCFEKEPLFPFQSFQSFAEADGEVPSDSKMVLSSSVSDHTTRKTMAATLVERSKKQSVAPVPKVIAKLAQRFFPLFNPALYPHEPPPAAVANRVLFTDAEDELLAVGLMEYNTDWKAIQERFLPCKSKHQIFVRQKNRSSSRAPENPIKAVRRIKNSPLTAEEKTWIEEGLKVFKLDWMSVWKFIVPNRDPFLLPRQWQIATGTQKSYKTDKNKKESRRLGESKRRKCKPATLTRWKSSSEKKDYSTDNAGGENNSRDDCIDNEDEAYVHEAFLGELPVSNFGEKSPSSCLLSQDGSHVNEQMNDRGIGDTQPQTGHEFPASLKYSQHQHTSSHFTNARHCASYIQPNHAVSDMTLRSFKSHFHLQPYQACRTNSTRLVKLAADLPPVCLPPSACVMSQSAFKSYHGGASTKVSGDNPTCALLQSSNDVNRNTVNNARDQSLPEIVMEQEELSDSEEEIGELVEFDREEMADSEGEEGSDSEQMVNIQNKEVANVATEKVGLDADSHNHV